MEKVYSFREVNEVVHNLGEFLLLLLAYLGVTAELER
jgi:hypothetical protein